MPRLTTLDDIFFPVEELPIFATRNEQQGERRLSVPSRKALVNRKTGHVLGVVSRDYRLVTNQQALQLAYECCRAVFPTTQAAEWDVNATDAPSTGGHCTIDL